MAFKFNPFTGNLDLVDTTTAAGSDTQVQFNDGGSLAGDADLTWNKTTNVLTNRGDISLDDGGSFTTTVQCVTPTLDRTISLPNATGTVALVAGSSGQLIWNSSGAQAGVTGSTVDGSGNVTLTSVSTGLGTAGAPTHSFTGDTNTGIYSPGADQVAISTNGTGRLFVDSSGRVGVNTASPDTLLHLSDDTALFIRLQRTGGSPSICSVANSGNVLYLSSDGSGIQFNTGATPTEAARIDSSGRLLIGTSSARASTNFKDGGYTTPLQIEGAADNISFGPTFVANTGTTNPTFRGAIATLARTRGTSIGSNTSVSSGDLLGTLQFSGADGTNLVPAASITAYVDTTPGTDDMPGRLVFFTTADGASSPTERMVLNSNGALLVQGVYDGTTADAANVNVTSNGSMRRSTSSIKYKTDVETIENQYADAVLQCRPVWYRSTCEGDCPEHSWWGFIAEEVAKIDPRLVHWKATESVIQEDGSRIEVPCDPEPEGVQYDRFVPHLLNLIKRQGEAITDLQAKVANLEGGAN